MFRLFAILAAVALLTACTNPNDLDEPTADLGTFALGHNVVVASKMTRGPVSREASEEEWTAALSTAIDARFSRYEGQQLYHVAVSVEGYVLAYPGIPLIASPNSVLILLLTVWDDAAGVKLNEAPEQITVIETISGRTILGSGLTQSKEVQMQNLSRNAAKQIETFMVRKQASDGWFAPRPGTVLPAAVPDADARPGAGAPKRPDAAQIAAEDPAQSIAADPAQDSAVGSGITPPAGAILDEPVLAAPQRVIAPPPDSTR